MQRLPRASSRHCRPARRSTRGRSWASAATGRVVLAAHHAGLSEAVAYLDEHVGARRGHGGVQRVSGQGLLAVGFDRGAAGTLGVRLVSVGSDDLQLAGQAAYVRGLLGL